MFRAESSSAKRALPLAHHAWRSSWNQSLQAAHASPSQLVHSANPTLSRKTLFHEMSACRISQMIQIVRRPRCEFSKGVCRDLQLSFRPVESECRVFKCYVNHTHVSYVRWLRGTSKQLQGSIRSFALYKPSTHRPRYTIGLSVTNMYFCVK